MFYGNVLQVLDSANWIAAFPSGRIVAFEEKPEYNHQDNRWNNGSTTWSPDIHAELEGIDWQDTLIYCPDDLFDLSRLAYWFCYFYENPLQETDRKAAGTLFGTEQAEFIRTAILNNCFPQEVYDQCKQIKNQEIKHNVRLSKKWDNMVCFASQIRKGMHYYYCTLDRDNRPGYALWSESKEDKRRFKKGLCFFSADAAKNWADGMI